MSEQPSGKEKQASVISKEGIDQRLEQLVAEMKQELATTGLADGRDMVLSEDQIYKVSHALNSIEYSIQGSANVLKKISDEQANELIAYLHQRVKEIWPDVDLDQLLSRNQNIRPNDKDRE